ncbi:Ail/Lom family outer membrane beta-barrel protein, partial [Escherichia coli]
MSKKRITAIPAGNVKYRYEFTDTLGLVT